MGANDKSKGAANPLMKKQHEGYRYACITSRFLHVLPRSLSYLNLLNTVSAQIVVFACRHA